jgi:hypothetical protein
MRFQTVGRPTPHSCTSQTRVDVPHSGGIAGLGEGASFIAFSRKGRHPPPETSFNGLWWRYD